MNRTLMTPLIAAAAGTLATIGLLATCGSPSYPSNDPYSTPTDYSGQPGPVGPPGAPGSGYTYPSNTWPPPTASVPSDRRTRLPIPTVTCCKVPTYTYQPPRYTYKPPVYTYKPPKRY